MSWSLDVADTDKPQMFQSVGQSLSLLFCLCSMAGNMQCNCNPHKVSDKVTVPGAQSKAKSRAPSDGAQVRVNGPKVSGKRLQGLHALGLVCQHGETVSQRLDLLNERLLARHEVAAWHGVVSPLPECARVFLQPRRPPQSVLIIADNVSVRNGGARTRSVNQRVHGNAIGMAVCSNATRHKDYSTCRKISNATIQVVFPSIKPDRDQARRRRRHAQSYIALIQVVFQSLKPDRDQARTKAQKTKNKCAVRSGNYRTRESVTAAVHVYE